MSVLQNTLTIYPTAQRLSEAGRGLAAGDNDIAMLRPEMMTFDQFENRLRAELIGPYTAISGFGRTLLIGRLVEKVFKGKSSGWFSRSWKFPGFHESLIHLFDELGAGLVEPEQLEKVIGFAPGKESQLKTLYSMYHDQLRALRYHDSGSLRLALIKALDQQGKKTPLFLSRFESITVKDIYQFTPYRFELFRKLGRMMPVSIIFPMPDSRERAFGFIVSNLEKFEALADKAGYLETSFEEPDSGPLSQFRENIFELGQVEGDDDNYQSAPVSLLSCSSRYREIEEVGSAIRQQRDERNLDWSDFVVLFRDIKPYGAIVDDVFKRYSIPFFFKHGLKLDQSPLVRAVLALFTCIESSFAREDMVRILGSPYFQRFRNIDIDKAQSMFLAARIIDGSPAKWSSKLQAVIKKRDGKPNEELSATAQLTSQLQDRLAKFSRQNNPVSFMRHLTRLFAWLELTPKSDYAGEKSEAIKFRDYNAYAELMATIEEAQQVAGKLGAGDSTFGFRRIRDFLLAHLARRDMPEPGTMDLNRVQALNIHDSVGLNNKHVFICGLHEGEFPPYALGSSILTDDERIEFNKLYTNSPGVEKGLAKGRKVFDKALDKWHEETLLFYLAIKSANERITFTYSLQELNGSPLMRSQFIDDVLDVLAPGIDSQERERNIICATDPLAIFKDTSMLYDQEEVRTRLIRDIFFSDESNEQLMARIGTITKTTPQWKRFRDLLSLASMERGRDIFFIEPDVQAKVNILTEFSGDLSASQEKLAQVLILKKQGKYSPTALEKYGQCPFRYFAAQILDLKPVDEPVMEMEAKTAGSMAHEIVEKFYASMIKRKRLPLNGDDDERKLLEKEAESIFKQYEKCGKLGDLTIWSTQKKRFMAMLHRWLIAEVEDQAGSGFVPIAVEQIFDFTYSNRTASEPYQLSIPCGGDRYLAGIIDRIDINKGQNAVRMIDYKLSSNDQKYKKMLKRENLGVSSFQAPLYMLLAKDYIERETIIEKVEQVQGGYRLFKNKNGGAKQAYILCGEGLKPGRNKDSFWAGTDDDYHQFKTATVNVIEKIEGGLYPVTPLNCDFCDFAGLCRYRAIPSAQMAGES